MECQSSDSKKLFKVFDASKRKRTRKKRDGVDDNSVNTDDSASGCQANVRNVSSAKASLQDVTARGADVATDSKHVTRGSSPSMSPHSPRRHRRSGRENMSLALKAGLVSTPRSVSPTQGEDCVIDSIPRDQDSFIYAFLEEAIKRDKKKQRYARRQEERRGSPERAITRERHRRRRQEQPTEEREKGSHVSTKDTPEMDKMALFETFAKFCKEMNVNSSGHEKAERVEKVEKVRRTHSHKSLQCEVPTKPYEGEQRPARMRPHIEQSRENLPPRVRSHEEFNSVSRSKIEYVGKDKCGYGYESIKNKRHDKIGQERSRIHNEDHERYDYYNDSGVIRSNEYPYYKKEKDYRDDDRRDPLRGRYDEEKRRYEEKNSRSYDVQREGYHDDDRISRRGGVRNEKNVKHCEDRRYEDRENRDRYYDEKTECRNRRYNNLSSKERRSRRNLERFERTSLASKDEDYRDRFSERDRDSGLSVADGETSTVSGKSNYLRVVKQEIAEQREAMDKMMKLWKELMKCFKGISQTPPDKSVNESATSARDSAAAQLRLWRECMRRYETVARDVGDTDARLMEEINKQRSEMSEMAGMWQECLQRYRDMSNDFNSLKKQVTSTHLVCESPTRAAPPPAPAREGEGLAAAAPAPYHVPPGYPPVSAVGGYGAGLRGRASAPAPPAWWWCPEGARSPRRRSSPESRASRDREHRRRRKDSRRDDSRYKEKSKSNASRSEQKHRKR